NDKRVFRFAQLARQVADRDDLVDELLLVIVARDEQVQLAWLVADEIQQLLEVPLPLRDGTDSFVENDQVVFARGCLVQVQPQALLRSVTMLLERVRVTEDVGESDAGRDHL